MVNSEIKNNGTENRNYKLFMEFFFLIWLTFSVFMHQITTSDHVSGYTIGNQVGRLDVKSIISGARYTSVFIHYVYLLLKCINVTIFQNKWIIQVMGIALYAASATIIFRLFEKCVDVVTNKVKIIFFLAILITFINPFMIETYMYGAFDFALGIFLSVMGSFYWCRGKNLLAVFWGFLGLSTYQSNIFIMLSVIMFYHMVYFINDNSSLKEFVLSEVKCVLVCLGIVVGNVAIQKIGVILINMFFPEQNDTFVPVKNFDVGLIGFERIRKCIGEAVLVLWRWHSMLPKGFMLAVGLAALAMVAFWSIQNKRFSVFVMFVIVSGICITSYFSYGLVYSVFYPQRTTLGLFLVFSLICITLLSLFKVEGNYPSFMPILTYGMIILLSIVLYSNTQVCITDAYTAQALDENEVKMIEHIIEDYEKQSGVDVKSIASCGSDDFGVKSTYLSDGLIKNYKGLIPYNRIPFWSWSRGEYINYVNGTDYSIRLMDEDEVNRYFPNKETIGYFDPKEQLVFEGDTLFWRVY